jgi:AraC-like DNA-binding protein
MVTEKEARLVKDIISFSGNKSSRLLYLYAKAIEFIALITQNIVQDDITNSKSRLDLDEIQILETVKSILINNMKKPPTIKSLARNVGISESKLKKDFKSYYGTTIFGYLRDKRLEHAKNLLYNNQLTIYEVANSVGFTNASKFAVAFRNKYGVNPSDTRKF